MKSEKEYNNILENRERKFILNRPQYSVALQLFKKINYGKQKKTIKVLDLGCGTGEFTEYLKKEGVEKIICVDGVEEFLEKIKKKGYETYKVNLEFEKLPFSDNSFDLVVSLDVIEHLWNTKHYFDEISRVLKPEGLTIITTPNYNYLRYRIYYLLGKFEKKITPGTRHKRFFTDKSFNKVLSNRFSVLRYIGSIPRIKKHFFRNRFLINIFSLQLGILARNTKK